MQYFRDRPGNVLVYGYLPVLPMVLGSAFFIVIGSLLTRPPSRATLEKYFSSPANRATVTAVRPSQPVMAKTAI